MSEDMDDEIEVNVTELSLDREQIDELIDGLQGLKDNRKSFEFTIDNENDLVFHHEEEDA